MARNNKRIKNRPRGGLGQRERKFVHLKEFSQGKPNEISFNVLEQKSAELDEKPKRHFGFRKKDDDLATPLPTSALTQSTSSMRKGEKENEKREKKRDRDKVPSHKHAATKKSAITSTFLGVESQAEIAQRQRRRKRYRRISIALVAVICLGFIGVGGYWFYQEQARLSTSVGVLHEACDIIAQTDQNTVAIDTYFQTAFNDDTVDTANGLIDSLPGIREDLESARVYASKAQGELDGSQRDKEAAEHTLATIDARETMLDAAESRMHDDIAAKQALDAVAQAQTSLDEGNALLAQAAQIVSDTTNDHVSQSTEYTTSAKSSLEQARTSLKEAQQHYPSADFSVVLNYIDKKNQAADEALLSNAAILIQDKATAEAHNDAYNAADSEATTLAQRMPQNLQEIVIQAYSANQEPMAQSYDQARSDAATQDAYLRDYLGTDSQDSSQGNPLDALMRLFQG